MGGQDRDALVIWFSIPVFLSLALLSVPIRHHVDRPLKWQRRIWYFGVESWLWTKASAAQKTVLAAANMTALPQMNVTFDKWMLLHLWLSSKSGTPPPPFEAQMGLFFRCAFKPVKSTCYPNTALGCCVNNLLYSCTCSCKLSAALQSQIVLGIYRKL